MKTLKRKCCVVVSGLAVAAFAYSQGGAANRIEIQPETSAQNSVTREVRHELMLLPYYGVFDNLAFRVDGSTVTLLGQVVNPVTKDDVGRAVKGIEGVNRVNNQIKVLPLSPIDNQIRRAEFRAVYSSPGFEKYAYQAVPPIHIVVENGHVTLEGVVGSGMDKILAGTRANTVPGVFSVTNNLRVEN
jgi:hyperosmotically inducible periplasmic protein